MTFTPDALHLGPLARIWNRLVLLLVLGVWFGTVRFSHAGGTVLVTLVTAWLAAAADHLTHLTLLDVRAGDCP